MNTNHSEQTTDDNNGDWSTPLGSSNLVLHCDDYRGADFEHWPRPTGLQLAQLAARLARTEDIDPKQLVNAAWNLFRESCQKIQEDHLEVESKLRIMEAEDNDEWDELDVVPKPAKFPVTFDQMERLLLPKSKGRTADRAAVFREYFFAQLVGWNCAGLSKGPDPSYWNTPAEVLDGMRARNAGEVARVFGLRRSTKYDSQTYDAFARRFLRWHQEWSTVRKSQVKARNATKGWETRRKAKKRKTGARLNLVVLRQAIDPSPPA